MRRRGPGGSGSGRRTGNPAQVIALAFAAGIGVGTGLLALPAASATPEGAGVLDALFTATSAVCVTGLTTVDTGTSWSTLGHVVIAALMQVGGLGIMTVASLLVVLVSRRLGLRARLVARAQSGTNLDLSDVRRVLRDVVLFSLAGEALTALALGLRLLLAYDAEPADALWEGVFHAVSAFNNGGFVLWPEGMARFAGDPWMLLPVALAVIAGGLGFPVIFELARSRRPGSWSVTTRITVLTSGALLVAGTALLIALEYGNPATLGPMGVPGKLLAGFFSAVMPRSGGFSTVDVGSMTPESWLATDVLMFIGGGSASTAGGIKVTTFGLLAVVLWSEVRGEADVDVARRRIPEANQRQALAVALLGVGLALAATFALLGLTEHDTDRVLFEALSALGTVGLSTGITSDLPAVAEVLLVVLMFVGRLGPLALASALALRERPRLYRRPEERTIIG